jgi:hypothetical protein
MYQLLLIIPALIWYFNKKISRILLLVTIFTLFSLIITNNFVLQIDNALLLLMALTLALDPAVDTHMISIITLISLSSIIGEYKILLLSVLIFIALIIKNRQGKSGLSLTIALLLTILFKYLNYPFADFPLIAFLLGIPPFHKWLNDIYSKYTYTGTFIAVTTIAILNENLLSYSSITPILLFLSSIMMINGIFQGMISKKNSEYYFSLHQILFGLNLTTITITELNTNYISLLIPSFLSLFIIQYTYNNIFKDPENSLFQYGGLSNSLKTEALSILMCYTLFFSIISIKAEDIIKSGISSNILFLMVGCVLLFIAAGSLAVFYRNYAITFEGYPKNSINTIGSNKLLLISLISLNTVFTLFPSLISILGVTQNHVNFPELNILLIIIITSIIFSAIISTNIKTGKIKSWTTGYTSIEELQKSKSDPLKTWEEIFKFIYIIKIPDDQIIEKATKINKYLFSLFVILLVVLVVIV